MPAAGEAWERHVPPISSWTNRIFFASIGFAIPVHALFRTEALGYGAILSICAIASKLVTGVCAGWNENTRLVGWAMVGRGKLGIVW